MMDNPFSHLNTDFNEHRRSNMYRPVPLQISTSGVRAENMDYLREFSFPEKSDEIDYLFSTEQHYKLLSHLSGQFNDKVLLDVGTGYGASGLALAQNSNNRVITYDVEMKVDSVMDRRKISRQMDNLLFYVQDCRTIEVDLIQQCPLIFLDVDPHDGVIETQFIQRCRDFGFQGWIVADDTRQDMFPALSSVLSGLPERKLDITSLGHFSGTTLICFNNQPVEIVD